ncbi:hypothetical protein [Lysobacter silvisoli]|uniref:Uncharacterized protein n=1 Tax=Lysobacter silvisoli TaxID=2293254 RepID=A0A371K3I3_9GAMM|nr:hypothetical protein [Lysobacter silvisoli]RDZ28397.1 hypothetical protein DX914_04470 [Lysobacter silvisoli]
MNATNLNAELNDDRPAPRAVAAVHPTHTFRLLLRREFWEHRGGFLWAPAIAGAISLLLLFLAIVFFETVVLPKLGQHAMEMGGDHFMVNGVNLSALIGKMSAEDLRQMGGAIDLSLYGAALWPYVVVAFVVFFYCLGSLYDERKDRSVLFWKSLPVSDGQTVLSKAVSATLVAPLLATAAAIVTMFGYLLVMSGFVLLHGGNPIEVLWGPGSPLTVAFHLIATVPIQALWMLPTVGWLMLCSAWARSMPFLWALLIPVIATLLLGWITLMGIVDTDSFVWVLQNISARALFSGAPGWIQTIQVGTVHGDGPAALHEVLNLATMYSVLGSAKLWIGALAGAAMIYGAVRLRRWRDDG